MIGKCGVGMLVAAMAGFVAGGIAADGADELLSKASPQVVVCWIDETGTAQQCRRMGGA